jgi:NADPH2:quinone reductase
MKAIRVREFGAPGVLKIENVDDPKAGSGQVVIDVKAAGINPVDTYIRAGTYARKPTLPYTPGTDAGGIVESVGAGVTRVKPGDRVYVSGTLTGTYAEKCLCDASRVHPLPDRVGFAPAAGIYVPYATAYQSLVHLAKGRAGETLLVHGASGGVGGASVQIARAIGMTIIGTAGSDRGRQLVRDQGAHHVLDHHASDFADQVSKVTGGKGPDVILEMLANVNLAKDLQMIGMHGRIVVIGNRGTIEINPRDGMMKDATVQGMLLFNASEEDLARIHAALYAGMEIGSLRPIVGQEFKLEDAPKAHEAVMTPGAFGKIVLLP